MSASADRRSNRRARQRALAGAATLAVLGLVGCSGNRVQVIADSKIQHGVASWYGPDFHGKATASGEIFDTYRFTAAHRSLPFGTVVEVKNLTNGRTVRVRINDRGPFVKGRIIDLTYAAADALDMLGDGTAKVELTVLPFGTLLPNDPVLASTQRFTVQVGAFGDANRARRLCDELRAKYPEVSVSDDGAWHRVQVGEFRDRNLAEDLKHELQQLGFAALIVLLQ